jgi:hypothetical protein
VAERFSAALTTLPTAAVTGLAVALAWREQGSVLAEDWLVYALATGLLVATVLASGFAIQPAPWRLVGLAGLLVLALWTALSASWSPVPALARDEALLIVFYGLALAVPMLTLRSEAEREAAVAIVVVAAAALVIAACIRLLTSDDVADTYRTGRLATPIGYPGAETAIFLLSFWPAAAFAARRRLPVAARALAFGASVALLAGWLMTQSRAGAVALALSAVVVFVVCPARLRLLAPVVLAAALGAASYVPLTEPFRAEEAQLEDAIRDAGRWALLLSLVGAAVGVAYALGDRRLALPRRVIRAAGIAAVAAVAVGAGIGLGGYLVAVDKPVDYLADRWDDFKREPEHETGSSHFATLGSNRYDLWRVALNEFRENPLGGAGARSFGTAYLQHGRTDETPRRGHSLQLDVLSETGVIGLALLLAALVPLAWVSLQRARSDLLAAGVLGGIAYWLVHASGDWIWTFPAVALPFWLLLGAGAGPGGDRRITTFAAPAGIALAAAAVVMFAPPWLSSRFSARALEEPRGEATDELRWARRLDPLAVDPLVAESKLATSPSAEIEALRRAVDMQPRTLALHYLLGLAYLDAGSRTEAIAELQVARRLAPRSPHVARALRQALRAGPRGE